MKFVVKDDDVMSYKPYPKYKPSGVEWIGEIPEGWLPRRLKYSLAIQTEKAGEIQPDDFRMALENVEGWTGSFVETGSEFEGEGVRFAEGDLLFGKLRPYLAKVFEATHSGTAVGEFFVLKPKADIQSRYMFYRLLTKESIEVVNSSTYGAKMPRTSWEFMGGLKLPVPPASEQTKIAAFLDRKTTQIDKLIKIKRKQIELLKEERTAIINQAVTKGLNPAAKMKDSGIEWIGEIPEGWEIKKIKHVLDSQNHRRIPLSGEVRGAMTERSYDYYGASGVIDKVEDFIFDEPLILVGEDGANLYSRSTALAFKATGKYWVNNHAHILRPINGNIDYLTYMLESLDYTIFVTGSAQPKLTSDNLMNISIVIPSVEEQGRITEYIAELDQEVIVVISKAEQQIKLLEEYRTTLISDAVTGKIDIREEAA